MAKRPELIVEIDAAGKVHVEVKGAPGKKCMEYLELLRSVLGPVESQSPTAELYESEAVNQKNEIVARTKSTR